MPATLPVNQYQYGVTYTPENTTQTGVTWSIALQAGQEGLTLGNIATITTEGILTVKAVGIVELTATSSVEGVTVASTPFIVTIVDETIEVVSITITGEHQTIELLPAV